MPFPGMPMGPPPGGPPMMLPGGPPMPPPGLDAMQQLAGMPTMAKEKKLIADIQAQIQVLLAGVAGRSSKAQMAFNKAYGEMLKGQDALEELSQAPVGPPPDLLGGMSPAPMGPPSPML